MTRTRIRDGLPVPPPQLRRSPLEFLPSHHPYLVDIVRGWRKMPVPLRGRIPPPHKQYMLKAPVRAPRGPRLAPPLPVLPERSGEATKCAERKAQQGWQGARGPIPTDPPDALGENPAGCVLPAGRRHQGGGDRWGSNQFVVAALREMVPQRVYIEWTALTQRYTRVSGSCQAVRLLRGTAWVRGPEAHGFNMIHRN
eukprot:CAMPEP_0194300282 /NCGR_PEP_ID=MMETSP0169-20130528/61172_1 /TAXON_ID=218684 /ORGANISM="Corethron pennatum, Strain L29A3" /LENGTH=196 /DNA_ID=CAMNT_0039050437 /DNA_START=596 /DNA_END=1187 /DNA_ORIENTATION=+